MRKKKFNTKDRRNKNKKLTEYGFDKARIPLYPKTDETKEIQIELTSPRYYKE